MSAHPFHLGPVLVGRRHIAAAVRRVAEGILDDLHAEAGGGELTVVSVLNGALVFTADLVRHLDVPLRIETVRARSYRGDATTPGDLALRMEDVGALAGRHVLLVDDILDTGRTMHRLRAEIRQRGPASVRIAVLLDKPARRAVEIEADHVGLEIPDVFVVGYGLDHEERFRNLPDIHELRGDGA